MNTTDYRPVQPILCGRIAGKLATAVYAGELDFDSVRWAALDMLQGADMPPRIICIAALKALDQWPTEWDTSE